MTVKTKYKVVSEFYIDPVSIFDSGQFAYVSIWIDSKSIVWDSSCSID